MQKAAEKVLVGLVPDSQYRVKIQTMNEFGKSHWSKDFEFDTHGGRILTLVSVKLYDVYIIHEFYV